MNSRGWRRNPRNAPPTMDRGAVSQIAHPRRHEPILLGTLRGPFPSAPTVGSFVTHGYDSGCRYAANMPALAFAKGLIFVPFE